MDYLKVVNEMMNKLRDWQEEEGTIEATRLKIAEIRRIYFTEYQKDMEG